ncbi:hypothetical protein M5689_001517 [Euphorbia peplus]|nr:hypothetical protein M5689_001517 [Euphorbia peplus]
MFRSNRLSSLKSRAEKLDFKFSNFQALQVPKGWEKLYVSIICVETGKTVAKTGKAFVKNGSCQWTQILTETVSFSKEIDECLFKLVVSMGSVRSGILGEAMVDLVSYTSSKNVTPVSLPLKMCNHGTVLQVKIQCLTPRSQVREKQRDGIVEGANTEHDDDDMDDKSDISDNSSTRNARSSSSNHFDSLSQAGDVIARDLSFSASSSRHSLDSTDDSLGRENLTSTVNDPIGRQDSTGSQFSNSPYSVNGSSRSNHSSFNSKLSTSQSTLQNQRYGYNQVSRAPTSSLLLNADSSKDLLEAAEVKIEEFRAEAMMWEQNARKLMTDVEKLRWELSAQSNHQASLEMELSESRIECEGLKQEIERVTILLGESTTRQKSTENAESNARQMENLQKELENEMKFQRESNADLTTQLKKTQESNIELVCILQELENTIEEQKTEIANLSNLHPEKDDVRNCSSGYESNGDIKPNQEVSLMVTSKASAVLDLEGSATEHGEFRDFPGENNRITEQQILELQESQKTLQCTIQSLETFLQEKVHEIEAERGMKTQVLLECEEQWREKLAAKEEQIISLEAKLSEVLKVNNVESLHNNKLVKEAEILKKRMDELEKDCNELTDENLELVLQLKESKRDLPTSDALFKSSSTEVPENNYLCTSESEVGKMKSQICKLEEDMRNKELLIKELTADPGKEVDKKSHLEDGLSELEISEFDYGVELSKTLSELYKQINFCLAQSSNAECCNDSHISYATDICGQKDQAVAILNSFIQLKDLFEAKFVEYEDELKQKGEVKARLVNADAVQNNLKTFDLKENTLSTSNQGEGSLQTKSKPQFPDSGKEIPVISDTLLIDQVVEALKNFPMELDTQVNDIQNAEGKLETSTCFDSSQDEILVLDSSTEFHVSADKILAMELSELKISKQEVEVHLSELEKENSHLTERICGLEAQLRYMTDERESSRLELQNSESCSTNLQEEIRRLERDMERLKDDQKKNLNTMKQQWLEVQEECEYLKVVNLKLQTTAENLIDECSLLQKSTVDLRRKNVELNLHYEILEAELRESRQGFSGLSKLVEAVEGKYCSMLEEFASKEKALHLEMDALLVDNKKYNEELMTEVNQLNQMYLEKVVEVENLHRQLGNLTELHTTHDENGRTALVDLNEISRLHADKATLEASLREVQGKLKLSETNLCTAELKSETKLSEVKDELAVSKQKQIILMADHEKLLDLLEDVKSEEERHKNTVRLLELKLKASAFERIQLEEDISILGAQLQKTGLLQNEILALKTSLNKVQLENRRLEVSIQMLSEDCEQLEIEKMLFVQKISDMQTAISELDYCKRTKVLLEEKVLRLAGDLTAREALGAQDAELKNELYQVKRANCALHRKIKYLQEENGKGFMRAQAFQGELKRKEPELDSLKFNGASHHLYPEYGMISNSTADTSKLSEVFVKSDCVPKVSPDTGTDPLSKIQMLENELAEALEANDMYKVQLKSFLSGNHSNAGKDEADVKEVEDCEDRTSAVETELREMQDRYFHMSLKCAEVEAEREQLVLKLRAVNCGRS